MPTEFFTSYARVHPIIFSARRCRNRLFYQMGGNLADAARQTHYRHIKRPNNPKAV